jgi:two-component system, sensor histidine kinase PdtaS
MILVRYVLLLGVLFFVQVTARAAFIDSVAYYKKQLYKSTTPVNLKIKTYYNLYGYYETTNYQLAQAYFKRGYYLTRKYHSKYGMGFYHKITAYNELVAGRIQLGIGHSKSAANYFKAIKDTINFVESNYFAAYGLQLNQQQQAAKELLLSSLKTLPPNRFYKQQGMLYSSLSYLENDHDLVQSLDYLMKSKEACLKANNQSGLYSIYSDLSLFYSNIDDYQTALYYAKQSLYCVKKIKPIVHFDLATVASNVAATLIALKRFESALYYVNQSLFAAKKVDSRVFEEKGLMYKIEIFLALKRYDQAEKLLQLLKKKQLDPISLFNYHLFSLKLSSALEKFDRSNQHINSCDSLLATGLTLTKTIQLNYYDLLQSHYQQIGEEVKQVEALNRYNHFKIAQLEQQKDYRLIRLQLKSINTEKQLAQRALQQQRLKTSAIASSKQNERTYFIISVSFLLLILLVISWSIYLYRKRNRQLRKFNMVLEGLVTEKEVLLQEIHHRVKNNFQIITSILAIQSRQKDSTKESFLAQFSTRIHSMAFVHEKLYENRVIGQLDAANFLKELVNNSCTSMQQETTKIDVKVIGEGVYLTIDQLLPIGLIVNELAINSLKHAFHKQPVGTITLSVAINEAYIFIDFQDDGAGKSDPLLKNTGLIVVDAFVMKLKGTVAVNHENGLHYHFEFPLNDSLNILS